MMLHCSIRLGFFTWVYQNRLEIAFTLGLSDVKPITMCGHEYDVDRAIKIEVSHDDHDKLPANPFQVREINLFLELNLTDHTPQYALLGETQLPTVVEHDYASPDLGIFHPPA